MYLTLDSRDGEPSPTAGVLRFRLDSPLRQVSRVTWLTLEMRSQHTIDLDGETLHFSEELRFFEAVVPRGSYTLHSLQVAVAAAMASARAREDGRGPSNEYEVRLLADSQRVSIAAKAGTVPFVIHLFGDVVKVLSLRRMAGGEQWQITFLSSHASPMLRGSVVEICCPSSTPVVAKVLHALGTMVVVSLLEGACLEETADEWTMRPCSTGSLLPELLGLGVVDQKSSTPMGILSWSGFPACCVSTQGPHGLTKGDVVVLDGIEGALGEEKVVEEVLSEQQVRLGMAPKPVGVTFECARNVYHCVLDGGGVGWERDGYALMTATGVVPLKATEWAAVQIVPPFPCREWGCGGVCVMRRADGRLVFRVPAVGSMMKGASSLTSMVVVGVKKVIQDKQVVLMRMWMGLTEAYGVSSGRARVFGRAQVKGDGFLTSTDHSVVGSAVFSAPLERVPFVDISFLTSQGKPIPAHLLGEFSLLLQIEALL